MSSFIENFQVSILKALAHPTRLKIVIKLQQGTKCVTDIHEILPASQANISQHLTILRNAESSISLKKVHSAVIISVALS